MSDLIKFNRYDGVTIRLTKVTDTRFNGQHPNDINVGYIKEGIINIEKSNEHQCFLIIKDGRFFNTSQVLILEEKGDYDLAYTVNSVYKVEKIVEEKVGELEENN